MQATPLRGSGKPKTTRWRRQELKCAMGRATASGQDASCLCWIRARFQATNDRLYLVTVTVAEAEDLGT
ncbi:hypothetical protein CKO25_16180 [Thiocapsa imhoffii]|uniref:Uncharacterized protein n=1 Tax=Thiocapsa imhoffii TaxID=382777 RepID=A0A9X0WKJ9_9GAMM|nr:hypothetical protein [Thiocapsa imhoffii]